MIDVFAPSVQLEPKIVSGPIKKKMVEIRNTIKNKSMPMKKSPYKHPPLLSLFFVAYFIDPNNPATPSSKKIIEEA